MMIVNMIHLKIWFSSRAIVWYINHYQHCKSPVQNQSLTILEKCIQQIVQ